MTEPVLGRMLCGDFEQAVRYEWLVTNGIGGYACGTVAEAHTRRYHGLLMAALTPPTGRTLLLSKLDICAHYRSHRYDLFSNEFADGSVTPKGFVYLESFRLDEGLPVWRYAMADALIEKRIAMQPGSNTTLVSLKVLRASDRIALVLTPLCSYRDYHQHGHAGRMPTVHELLGGFEVSAFADACRYRVVCGQAEFVPDPVWHLSFKHRQETTRGLDDTEDLFRPGYFRLLLNEGERATLTATDELSAPLDFHTVDRQLRSERQHWLNQFPTDGQDWLRQLALAARQFIVARWQKDAAAGQTVIAGYPWFTDWGRDTMIALPGLTLALGHFDIAGNILKTFAGHVSQGMIPNRFPDHGTMPAYNTVDATLWFVHAIDQYVRYSGDSSLATELYPALTEIIDWHRRGCRYGICVDPDDGLLAAGEAGVQLTWMDAKVDDWVVTPRIGKCVEINALWYNALMIMVDLAKRVGDSASADAFGNDAIRVKDSFGRFWNQAGHYLFDVLDGPEGTLDNDGKRYDATVRPNQLFAVSLPYSPLGASRQKAVVDLCTRELLTSYGLRSLAAGAPGYAPYYRGSLRQRDGAYHQGTVWAWLIGPFVDAHYRVYRNAQKALSFLEPLRQHLNEACLGQLGEIFDADPPFAARGCFAQAWSVAEILRVSLKLSDNGTSENKSISPQQ